MTCSCTSTGDRREGYLMGLWRDLLMIWAVEEDSWDISYYDIYHSPPKVTESSCDNHNYFRISMRWLERFTLQHQKAMQVKLYRNGQYNTVISLHLCCTSPTSDQQHKSYKTLILILHSIHDLSQCKEALASFDTAEGSPADRICSGTSFFFTRSRCKLFGPSFWQEDRSLQSHSEELQDIYVYTLYMYSETGREYDSTDLYKVLPSTEM